MKKFVTLTLIIVMLLSVTSFAKNKTKGKVDKKMSKKTVVFETNKGNITLEVYPDVAPKTVENFCTHVENGYYNGIIFHRIIEDFMIQGGDPTGTGAGGESIWGKNFEDEIDADVLGLDEKKVPQYGISVKKYNTMQGYTYTSGLPSMNCVRGTICMANAGPNTNGSQFFIVTKDECEWLDGRHTVFGKVVDGMDVVDKIEKVETDASDRPVSEIKIVKAYLKK